MTDIFSMLGWRPSYKALIVLQPWRKTPTTTSNGKKYSSVVRLKYFARLAIILLVSLLIVTMRHCWPGPTLGGLVDPLDPVDHVLASAPLIGNVRLSGLR